MGLNGRVMSEKLKRRDVGEAFDAQFDEYASVREEVLRKNARNFKIVGYRGNIRSRQPYVKVRCVTT
jgi:hypothetical protein